MERGFKSEIPSGAPRTFDDGTSLKGGGAESVNNRKGGRKGKGEKSAGKQQRRNERREKQVKRKPVIEEVTPDAVTDLSKVDAVKSVRSEARFVSPKPSAQDLEKVTQVLSDAIDEARREESIETEVQSEHTHTSENNHSFFGELKRFDLLSLTPEEREILKRITREDVNTIGVRGAESSHVLDALAVLGYKVLSVDHTTHCLELGNSGGRKESIRFADLKTAVTELRTAVEEVKPNTDEKNNEEFLNNLKYHLYRLTPEEIKTLRKVTRRDITNIGVKGTESSHVVDALALFGYEVRSASHDTLVMKKKGGEERRIQIKGVKSALLEICTVVQNGALKEPEHTTETPPRDGEKSEVSPFPLENLSHDAREAFLTLSRADLESLSSSQRITPRMKRALRGLGYIQPKFVITHDENANPLEVVEMTRAKKVLLGRNGETSTSGVSEQLKTFSLSPRALRDFVERVARSVKNGEVIDLTKDGEQSSEEIIDVTGGNEAVRNHKEDIFDVTGGKSAVAEDEEDFRDTITDEEAQQSVDDLYNGEITHIGEDTPELAQREERSIRDRIGEDTHEESLFPGITEEEEDERIGDNTFDHPGKGVVEGDPIYGSDIPKVESTGLPIDYPEVFADPVKDSSAWEKNLEEQKKEFLNREHSEDSESDTWLTEQQKEFLERKETEKGLDFGFGVPKTTDHDRRATPEEMQRADALYAKISEYINQRSSEELNNVTEWPKEFSEALGILGIHVLSQDVRTGMLHVESVSTGGTRIAYELTPNQILTLFRETFTHRTPVTPEEWGEELLKHRDEFLTQRAEVDPSAPETGNGTESVIEGASSPWYPKMEPGTKLGTEDPYVAHAFDEVFLHRDDPAHISRIEAAKAFLESVGYVFGPQGELPDVDPFDRPIDLNRIHIEDAPINFDGAHIENSQHKKSHFISEETASPKPNAGEKSREAPQFFDERFTAKFGISKEDLESINEFKLLTKEQQKLVFENLSEYAQSGTKGLVGKFWQTVSSAFGAKREGIPPQGSKGMEAYGNVLRQFIVSSANHGPKVHEENGELVPDLVHIEFDRAHRKEQWEAVRSVNLAAHKLARTPASWLEDGIGTHSDEPSSKFVQFFRDHFSSRRKHYLEYQELQKTYDTARNALAVSLEKAGMSKGEIALTLVELSGRVAQLQFAQTSPDALEALQTIEEPEAFKNKALEFVSVKGTYLGLGMASRSFSAETLKWLSGPAVAAAFGGIRGWNKSAAELRERDRATQAGKENPEIAKARAALYELERIDPVSRSGIQNMRIKSLQNFIGSELNVVSAVNEIDVNGEKQDRGLIQKTQRLIHAFYSLQDDTSPEAEKKRNEILDSLKNRAEYIQDKQRLNRINYGSKEEAVVNMAKLYETLGTAQMIVASYGGKENTNKAKTPEELDRDLSYRLEKYLKYREGAIHERRRNLQKKETAKAALIAGSISLAGVGIVHEFKELADTELGQNALKYLKNFTGLGGISPNELRPEDIIPDPEIPTVEAPSAIVTPESGDTPAFVRIPGEELVSESEKTYSIKRGDTLWDIMRAHNSEIRDLSTVKAQDNAIANILESLTSEELDRIGIRSHNVDLIYAGESINMEELNAIIDEKYDFVESAEDRFGEDTGDVTENEIGSKESPEYNPAPEYQTVPPENIPYDTETPRLVVNPEKLRGVMLEESGIPRKDFSAIRGIPARDLETLIESDSTLHRGTQSSIKKFIAMRDAFKILDSTLVPKGNETMEKFLERGTQEIASRYDVDEVVSALKKTLARRPREWSA